MTRNRSHLAIPMLILLSAFFVLAACGQGGANTLDGPPIALADLPPETGRGYGTVVVDGLAGDAENQPTGVGSGQLAPNFALQLEDGRYVTLRDLEGRPVMINFWATWCGPCRKEMPDIVAADQADDDLVVIAINVQEELDAIEPFVKEFGMTMPIGRDASGELRNLYEAAGMPTSIFIQPDGTVATKWSGLLTPDLLDAFLEQIRSTS